MRIQRSQAVIAQEKLTDYLLVRRTEDDKSQWLAQIGFTNQNPDQLKEAILDMLARHDAVKEKIGRISMDHSFVLTVN